MLPCQAVDLDCTLGYAVVSTFSPGTFFIPATILTVLKGSCNSKRLY